MLTMLCALLSFLLCAHAVYDLALFSVLFNSSLLNRQFVVIKNKIEKLCSNVNAKCLAFTHITTTLYNSFTLFIYICRDKAVLIRIRIDNLLGSLK